MNEKIVPAKIIHGCAKTWHTLPADYGLRHRLRTASSLPSPADPKACLLAVNSEEGSCTPLGVQGLVECSEQGWMRTPLGVRGKGNCESHNRALTIRLKLGITLLQHYNHSL